MSEEPDDAPLSPVRTVCDRVRTTMGPFGSSKIIVERNGTVNTASTGLDVIEGIDVDNSYLTLLAEAATGFESEYTDGTSTLVALTGALLERAADLDADGVHPSTVARGYRDAFSVADTALDRYSRPASEVGLNAVARTALTGVRDPVAAEQVGESVAEAVRSLPSTEGGTDSVDRVAVVGRTGGSFFETELVHGVVLDERPVVDNMPRALEDTRVALLSTTVDVPVVDRDRQESDRFAVTVGSFEDRVAIEEFERESFNRTLERVFDMRCECILTERAINDRVKASLSSHGILGLQRVDSGALSLAGLATGSEVVSSLEHLDEDTLGTADVHMRRKAGRDMAFVESDAGETVRTLFCRSPDPRSIASFEHSAEAALAATDAAKSSDSVVPGGGAVENSVSHDVARYARSVDDKHQLAVEAFADALTVIPRTLAENAGLDGTDALIDLQTAFDEGRHAVGVDAYAGTVSDRLSEDPVVDPTDLKRTVWGAATDLAVQLVRIDERLPATDLTDDDITEEVVEN
jgi:chaperonin GroEL (HSP60 family)